MITDSILLQEVKNFVDRNAYPEIIKQLKEYYVNKMIATDPLKGYEERDHWHRMIHCINDFDKELRKSLDSLKFRG
jgi:hypothetical protein